MEKHKYITYRESRNVYQIKLTVKVPDSKGRVTSKQIVKQTKLLKDALEIRDNLIKLYRLDVNLLLSAYKKEDSVKKRENSLLKEIMPQWYDFKRSTIELQTQRRYNHIVSRVIVPILGNMRMDDITHDILQQMIYTLYKNGYIDGQKQGMAVSSLRVAGIHY